MDFMDPFYPEDSDDFDFDAEFSLPAIDRRGEARGEQMLIGPPSKVTLARRFVEQIREKLDSLEKLLGEQNDLSAADVERLLLQNKGKNKVSGKVIEGVFDGEHMMGSDGRQYVVPQNYASKSKLVEGDILKLTVTSDGRFLYKQIGPIARERVIGMLAADEVTSEYVAIAGNKKWQILTASVTFHRAEPGDEVVVLVPKNAPSKWAAVENVIKKIGVSVKENSKE